MYRTHLTAVRVEEDELLDSRAVDALADVRPRRDERRRAQRYRPREVVVLHGLAVRKRREHRERNLGREEAQRDVEHARVDGRVHADGEVRAVLLYRAHGEERDDVRGVHLVEFRGRHVRPTPLREKRGGGGGGRGRGRGR
eukprot:31007-Pelagococcus_subviridis.AAC.5